MIAPVTDIEPAASFIDDEPDDGMMPHSPLLTNAPQDVLMKEAERAVAIAVQPTTNHLSPKIGTSQAPNAGDGGDDQPSVSTGQI